MKITGTFIDEISHDIPHQNWGKKEWVADFKHMKNIGIDTVVLIRAGYKKFLTYPSEYLSKNENCYTPNEDLVALFLELAEENGMSFYFGLYDSGKYWWEHNDYKTELDINKYVVDEVWQKYGSSPAFKGWYLTHEVSRKTIGAMELYSSLGKHCKAISDNLPTLISPYIDGTKAILSSEAQLSKADTISLANHEKEWDAIFDTIKGAVDIVAFQDGHVELHELSEYLAINKRLAAKHGLKSWSNVESFDRDMPIKFPPIKWDKLRIKLEAAQEAGVEKAITFEFSHFMSPQSCYPAAHKLHDRYNEWVGKS